MRPVAALLTIGVACGSARANDSSAELAAGGLVLTRSREVEMRSEDLFVSARAVRVRYRFLNTGPRDVTTLVAFPLPDVTGGPDVNVDLPNSTTDNFVEFETVVDGVPVASRAERRALVGQDDRTALLERLEVPLNPLGQAARTALDGLPRDSRDEVVRARLVTVEGWDDPKTGMKEELHPAWRLTTTYLWQQTFPSGRELTVEHRYRPVVGVSAGSGVGQPGTPREEVARYAATYCVDSGFLAAARRLAPKQPSETRIGYVLKTGANWAAPIGDFRLVVDKGHADNIVSFCGEGVRKIGPTQFEMRRRNFTPDRDLSVLIIGQLPTP